MGGGGQGGGGRDEDEGWNRRPVRTGVPVSRDSETSESEDDYGREEDTHPHPQVVSRSPLRTRAIPPPPRSPMTQSETDDDVPLAQQIPTALKAQKTIRRQVRDEIDDLRRRKRSERKSGPPVTPLQQQTSSGSQQQQQHQFQFSGRPRGASSNDAFSSTREALMAAAAASTPSPSANRPTTRPRTKTLPSNATNPFSPSDLRAKLLGIQTQAQTPSSTPQGRGHGRRPSDELQMRAARNAESPVEGRTLRPQRSFHRSRASEHHAEPLTHSSPPLPPPPPVPVSVPTEVKLGRSATSASRRAVVRQEYATPFLDEGHRVSLERARTTTGTGTRGTSSSSRRPSMDTREEERASPRRPPMPPLPSAEVVHTFNSAVSSFIPAPTAPPPLQTKQTWNQRVFVCGLQRYCQVEVDAGTSAGELLRLMEARNELRGGPNLGPSGGWMVFEICHDFGMERPIRNFELLSAVSGSWIADKSTNAFMAKVTTLAPVLSRSAVPTSSPVFSGYVQHEYKRGKWQKRWMELREHSLWLSKKENGKDQINLCSLHNFDAYTVTRVQKAPKGYVFAVKSTDNLSFFEDTSDYMHLFSCGEKDGAVWLEKIMLARSYVLYQDSNILTNTAVNAPVAGQTGAALSRAGTRKRPAQPLLTIGPVSASSDAPTIPPVSFEPGSLLARHR
ncbi:hypothetical protein BXZ70DRAFT_901145 [Cristinia sonorae]|uniref:PH domain-containing protein n=1 Tax=Cristinia sonorae TaxID=1940300 RepID=A0A8K0UEI5_9AGAR|nr:hypothetical protein BXZ70DRAFT_901145 [Cristinia sonorae]